MSKIEVTSGGPDLRVPADTPAGDAWYYGIGVPFQIAPGKAALSANIRKDYCPVVDFETGTDIILFDDLSTISAEGAIPISRNHEAPHPETGQPSIMMKYPVIGGFVPLGAKKADGSPHPHAGTGFGLSQVVPFVIEKNDSVASTLSEQFQFAYDGDAFRVLSMNLVEKRLIPGMTNAIPDGDDLLFTMWEAGGHAGIARWRHDSQDGWQRISYVPIAEGHSEPSLIRDVNGSFLFSARLGFDIRVWHSEDAVTWTLVIEAERLRTESPTTLNQAVDGTPYVTGNLHQERFTDSLGFYSLGREILCLWPLNDGRTGLGPAITARVGRLEFGAPPGGTYWCIDHPNANTLHLADGKWHNVLVYRVMEDMETCPWNRKGRENVYPAQTGCYVEEVISTGKPIPVWQF
jgi:hypothetical protein